MQMHLDLRITRCEKLHMRTTITIADDLLAKAQELSGRSGYSEAIVTALRDYAALRERLALLERLYARPVPHSRAKIKKARRKRRWSS
jgi:Arc/MetJ family transcription regulator